MDDFKWIWRMEYFHRMWARCTGLAYILPAMYFSIKFTMPSKIRNRLYFLAILLLAQVRVERQAKRVRYFVLIDDCTQGLMGWYMVKSGLENRFEDPNDVPRVSQYRLAAHLTMAFILYTSLLRGALDFLSPALQWPSMDKSIRPFKILAHHTKGMVYLTAISGNQIVDLSRPCNYTNI